jgi:tetratricopeptide (TPR) repeat protein
MIEGERFGDAVLDARRRTKELHPHSNTWGAYQCYGNPDFRLNLVHSNSTSGGGPRRFVSREEIRQNVADIASQATEANSESTLKELADLLSETPSDWRDGEMLAAFGQAYAALGQFEEAIAAYRQALADEKGRAPLWAAQQIANLLDRTAKRATGEQKTKLQKEAFEWLEKISTLADTAELEAIRAGYHKRNGEFSEALKACEKAIEFHKRAKSYGFFYPGLNAATLAYLLPHQDPGLWKQRIREFAEAAVRQRDEKRDIWSRAGVVDAMLLSNLWDGTLTDQQSQIMDAYVAVIKGGGSLREIDSILGQIKFLIDNLPPENAAVGPLRSILDGVKKKSLVPGAVRPARG